MEKTVSHYENQISLLKKRDSMVNAKLIKKLERRKRQLEKK